MSTYLNLTLPPDSAITPLLPELAAIPEQKARKPPNVTIEALLPEARDTVRHAKADREALVEAGLAWSLVEALPARVDALEEAEYLMHDPDFTRQAWRRFKAGEKEGRRILRDLVKKMDRLKEGRPDLQQALTHFRKQRSQTALIQALNQIATYGRDLDFLQAAGITTAELDAAAQNSKNLGRLLAASYGDTTAGDIKEIPDRAAAHVWEALRAIRKSAEFAFPDNPDRMSLYVNQYRRKKRR